MSDRGPLGGGAATMRLGSIGLSCCICVISSESDEPVVLTTVPAMTVPLPLNTSMAWPGLMRLTRTAWWASGPWMVSVSLV